MNKKGTDIPSILFAIATIFIIGILFFVFSHLASEIYSSLQTTINNNPNINATYANETLTTIQNFEQSMWDYAFLFIVIGYLIVMMILAFSTQANASFYFIFVIVGLFGLFLGVVLSNAWESFTSASVFSETIARFPITDAILDNFFTLYVLAMVFLTLIMLFGKRFVGTEAGGIG